MFKHPFGLLLYKRNNLNPIQLPKLKEHIGYSMSGKNILIIDDHQLFADGLALILGSSGENFNVTIYHDAEQLIRHDTDLNTADLILVDLHMPRFDGFSFLRSMRARKKCTPIGVISGTDNEAEIELSIGLGAKGFIPKDTASGEMLNAVKKILSGDRYLPMHWGGKIDWAGNDDAPVAVLTTLTPRQLEILQLMCDGLQNKQMATALGISVSSVKGHIELLFKNLNVNNRTACVIQGQKLGII